MLTFQIDRHSPPVYRGRHYKDKPKFVNGSEQHRRFILERNYNAVRDDRNYKPGVKCTTKGHHGMGVILDVTDDFHLVAWEGLKVLFIEVWFDGEGKSYLFHPSDLHNIRRKK